MKRWTKKILPMETMRKSSFRYENIELEWLMMLIFWPNLLSKYINILISTLLYPNKIFSLSTFQFETRNGMPSLFWAFAIKDCWKLCHLERSCPRTLHWMPSEPSFCNHRRIVDFVDSDALCQSILSAGQGQAVQGGALSCLCSYCPHPLSCSASRPG